MITVDFLIKEFPDGRLMFLIRFREGKNFRIHETENGMYYTWCPHEDDLKTSIKIYQASNTFNIDFLKKLNERREAIKRGLDFKPFYT